MSPAETFARIVHADAVRQDLRSRSVRGAAALALGTGGETVLRLVSTFILARLLVPGDFGLLGMVTALTAIAGQVGQLGLSTVTVQRRGITHGQVTNLFWINVALGLALMVLFCALSPLVSAFYQDPRLLPVTLAISTSFLWGSLTVQHEALMVRQMQQTRMALVRLGASLLSVGLAITLAVAKFGYWALVCQEIARTVLIAGGVWLACPWRPGFPDRNEDVRGLLRFGAELTLTQLFSGVVANVDRLVVGKLFGANAVGLYRQAQQLLMVPIEQLNAPIASVAQPGLSLLQDDAGRYRRYYQKIVFVIALGTMPIAAFAMVYARELTLVVLGPDWIGAVPFFRIFAAAAFIRPVLGTASTVLITRGKSRRLLVMTFVSQVTLLVLIGVGVAWGPEGVAMAYAGTAVLLLLPNLWFSFAGSAVTLGAFLRAIRTPAAASAVMALGLLALRGILPVPGSLMSLGAGCVVGTLLYGVSCALLPGGWTELNTLRADMAGAMSWRMPRGRERTAPAPGR